MLPRCCYYLQCLQLNDECIVFYSNLYVLIETLKIENIFLNTLMIIVQLNLFDLTLQV